MNILVKKASCKIQDSESRLIGLSCILCLVFCVSCLVPVALAQEVRIRIEAREAKDDGNFTREVDGDVVIEADEVIYINGSDAEEERIIDVDDFGPREREFNQDRRARRDGATQPRQRERSGQRPGGRLPPAGDPRRPCGPSPPDSADGSRTRRRPSR